MDVGHGGCLSHLPVEGGRLLGRGLANVDVEVADLAVKVGLLNVPLVAGLVGNVDVALDGAQADKVLAGDDGRDVVGVAHELRVVHGVDGSGNQVLSGREVDERALDGGGEAALAAVAAVGDDS